MVGGKQLILGFVMLGLGIIVGGCSSAKHVTAALPTEIACRVTERVFHNGWVTFGEIDVSSTGSYIWKVQYLASDPPRTETHTGQLPSAISSPLFASSRSLPVRAGIPTYDVIRDESRTYQPAGIDSLLSYLHNRHWQPVE